MSTSQYDPMSNQYPLFNPPEQLIVPGAAISGSTGATGATGAQGPAGSVGITGAILSGLNTVQAGTGSFINLIGGTGTVTYLGWTAATGTSAAINSLTSVNVSALNTTTTTLISGTGTFTQLSATGAGIANLTGSGLVYSTGQFSTSVTSPSISGASISATTLTSGAASFTQLNATGAALTGLSGTSLNYVTLVGGTGSFTSIRAATGSFTQLNATGAGITNLSGTSLNYATMAIGTGSFTQLNATGANLTGLSGSSLSYSSVAEQSLHVSSSSQSSPQTLLADFTAAIQGGSPGIGEAQIQVGASNGAVPPSRDGLYIRGGFQQGVVRLGPLARWVAGTASCGRRPARPHSRRGCS